MINPKLFGRLNDAMYLIFYTTLGIFLILIGLVGFLKHVLSPLSTIGCVLYFTFGSILLLKYSSYFKAHFVKLIPNHLKQYLSEK